MAKSKPGLPDGFEINVNDPAQLGDYLDEDYSGNAAKAIALKRAQAPKPQPIAVEVAVPPAPSAPRQEQRPATVPSQPLPRAVMRTETVLDLEEARRRAPAKAQASRRPDRVQFNMRPETVKMFEHLVEFVQRYSLQSDAKPAEIFDAIVSILHDAREEMSFNDVPRRGKWGTPTAKAFPTALGNAFSRAIASRYTKHRLE